MPAWTTLGRRKRQAAAHLRTQLGGEDHRVEGRAEGRDVPAELRLDRRDRRQPVRVGELDRHARRELHLHQEADQRLVVGEDMRAGLVELGADEPDVAMDEDVLPRNEHVAEHDQVVGLIEARRERVVERCSWRSSSTAAAGRGASPSAFRGMTTEIA